MFCMCFVCVCHMLSTACEMTSKPRAPCTCVSTRASIMLITPLLAKMQQHDLWELYGIHSKDLLHTMWYCERQSGVYSKAFTTPRTYAQEMHFLQVWCVHSGNVQLRMIDSLPTLTSLICIATTMLHTHVCCGLRSCVFEDTPLHTCGCILVALV